MGRARATSTAEKIERRQQILDAAGKLLLDMSYPDITIERIAKAAGLAKGTIFLYFPNKEDLFLGIAQQSIEAWAMRLRTSLHAEIRKGKVVGTAEIVRILTQSVDDDLVVELLAMLDDTLEQNIDKKRALQFKSFLKTVLTECGALMEAVLPGLARGGGVAVLNGVFVCLVGAYKVSNQSETIREVANEPGMEMFRRDFPALLEHVVTCYVSGFLGQNGRV